METFIGQRIIRMESTIYFAADMSKILLGSVRIGKGRLTPAVAIEWKVGKESPVGYLTELDHSEVRAFASRNGIPLEQGVMLPGTYGRETQ